MKKKNIVIGSRASQLALIQTEYVKNLLQSSFPDYTFSVKEIKTKGDKILSVGLSAIGDKGLFTKELETAILNNEIDFAVHSLKDLPTQLPQGLTIGAVTERVKINDVLISKHKFNDLPPDSKVGSSSLRRRSQLNRLRKDLQYVDIRGNLNTRLKKLDDGLYDAIVLAYAGIKRLEFEERITEEFSCEQIIPAVGQGALAVECRSNDKKILELLEAVNHKDTFNTTQAERTFLSELQGGCQVPIGAYATLKDNYIYLTGFVADLEGNRFFKDSVKESSPQKAGIRLADKLKAMGAGEVLLELATRI